MRQIRGKMQISSNIYRPLTAGLLLLALSFCAEAMDLEKKVMKAKLDNGLTVLMLERKFSPTVSLFIRYRVGAVDEIPGQTGAAHFLEHMMFKGTPTIGTKNYPAEKKLLTLIEKTGMTLDQEKKKKEKADSKKLNQLAARLKKLQSRHRQYFVANEIDRLYTENGGLDMNASTGQDVTTYFVNLPANKIELWARMEADRLINPVFRDFYTERDVILEERRQRTEVSPDGKLYESFMNAAYAVHPYGRPIIGLKEDISSMSPSAIRLIHEKYLLPENIIIAVVGDIVPKATLEMINRYFGKISRPSAASSGLRANEASPVEPPQNTERKVEVFFDANPSLIIGYHKPTAPSYEDYVFDVLETILGKGRTSRLYSQLVLKNQIAESVSVANGLPGSRYSNLFMVFAKPRHPHTNEEIMNAIFKELESIKTSPVTEEELVKAKKQIKMEYIKSLDSNSELASILSYYELLMGDYRYFSNYLSEIEKVTAGDISAAARKYLDVQNRTVAFLNKKSKENKDHP